MIFQKVVWNPGKSILKSKDFDKKGFGYKFMIPWLGEGILISEGQKWHNRRKMLTASFHYSVLESFREQMVEVAQKGFIMTFIVMPTHSLNGCKKFNRFCLAWPVQSL